MIEKITISYLLLHSVAMLSVHGQESAEEPDWAIFFESEEGAAAVSSENLAGTPADPSKFTPELTRWVNDAEWIKRRYAGPSGGDQVFWGNRTHRMSYRPNGERWTFEEFRGSAWRYTGDERFDSGEFESAAVAASTVAPKGRIPNHPWVFEHPVRIPNHMVITNSRTIAAPGAPAIRVNYIKSHGPNGIAGTWYAGHKLSTLTGLFAEGDHAHGLKLRVDLSEEETVTPFDAGTVEFRKLDVQILGLNSEWSSKARGYFINNIQFGYMKLLEGKVGEIHLLAGQRLLRGEIHLIKIEENDTTRFSYEFRFPSITLSQVP